MSVLKEKLEEGTFPGVPLTTLWLYRLYPYSQVKDSCWDVKELGMCLRDDLPNAEPHIQMVGLKKPSHPAATVHAAELPAHD